MKFKINEIFYSIQGEGFNTGMATVFVRLSGCNLSCEWCDTKGHEKVNLELSPAQLYVYIEENFQISKPQVVTFTGGEPLIQAELIYVFAKLWALQPNGRICIETNGSLPFAPSHFAQQPWITCSPKVYNRKISFPSFCVNEIKLVVSEEVKKFYKGRCFGNVLNDIFIGGSTKAVHYYLQPCADPKSGESNIKEVIQLVKENPRWKLSLQTHKMINIR